MPVPLSSIHPPLPLEAPSGRCLICRNREMLEQYSILDTADDEVADKYTGTGNIK